MERDKQRRWTWYEQIVDAVCAIVGLGVIALMAFREHWQYLGVLTSLSLLGYISARGLTRWLIGRIGENGNGKNGGAS